MYHDSHFFFFTFDRFGKKNPGGPIPALLDFPVQVDKLDKFGILQDF